MSALPEPESNVIRFEVPGAPAAKGRPRFSTRGGVVRTYTPAKTRAAELAFVYHALPYKPQKPLSGALHVDFIFYLPIPMSWPKKRRHEAASGLKWPIGKPDLDNFCKTALDSMNLSFFEDDSQVVRLTQEKRYGLIPRTVVTITPLE